MFISAYRSSRPVTVLGTVMGVRQDGNWFIHQVDATGPDGRRISFEVASRQRHAGSVTVRWDPTNVAEPRFVTDRPWAMYAIVALVIIAAVAGAWVLLT